MSMTKIVITGGPHTGKTTLFEALRLRLPNANYIPEPASSVLGMLSIKEQKQMIADPDAFCKACIEYSLQQEGDIMDTTSLTILDRSLIDTVAYARRDGLEGIVPDLLRHIELAKYTGAIVCDMVGSYAQDTVRYENLGEALRTHQLIRDVYEATGLPILQLSATSLEDRLALAEDYISSIIA